MCPSQPSRPPLTCPTGVLLAMGLALLLAGCGGGGSPARTVIIGTAVKGVVSVAQVTAEERRVGGWTTVGNAVTDPDGQYNLVLAASYQGGPLRITVSRHPRLNSRMTCDRASGCGTVPFGQSMPLGGVVLEALHPGGLGAGNNTIHVTPFTDAASKAAVTKSITDNVALDGALIRSINTAMNQFTGGTDLLTTEPVDVTNALQVAAASADRLQYSYLIAAIVELAYTDPVYAASGSPIAASLDTLAATLAQGRLPVTDAGLPDPSLTIAVDELFTAAGVQATAAANSAVATALQTRQTALVTPCNDNDPATQDDFDLLTGLCRHSIPSTDNDGDGVLNSVDRCPGTVLATFPKTAPSPFAKTARSAPLPSPQKRREYMPGEVLVKFKSGARKAATMRASVGAHTMKRYGAVGIEHWRLPAGQSVQATIDELMSSGQVEFAEPNYLRHPRAFPNDPLFSRQWAHHNTGQFIPDASPIVSSGTAGADMDMVRAWDLTTGSNTVVVAVIDDSIDTLHPDLAANIWTNTGEIPGNNIDDDANGYIDDVHGWDFVDNDNDTRANPGIGSLGSPEGHGTSVAGSIGAVGNNGIGVTGVAWTTQIMPLKFNFTTSQGIEAFTYAVNNGARIINVSWGGAAFSQTEAAIVNLLAQHDVLLVAASGNTGINQDHIADYPADYDSSHIMVVAESGPRDQMNFGRFGQTRVEIAAPGVSVYTTMPLTNSIIYGNSGLLGQQYDYTHGTSFSSPKVVGAGALILSQFPTASALETKARLMAGVDPLPDVSDGQIALVASGGRANVFNSLTVAPQPVLVIDQVLLDDSVGGNGNGVLESGETADLLLPLHNLWMPASGIQAVLTSTSSVLSVVQGNTSYGDLQMDQVGGLAGGALPLQIRMANTIVPVVPQELLLHLNLTTTEGASFSRSFMVEAGNSLVDGPPLTRSIHTSELDNQHHYVVVVPPGTARLTIETRTPFGEDLDIIFSPTLPIIVNGPNTQFSAGIVGNESIIVNNPTAGTYHLLASNVEGPGAGPYTYKLWMHTDNATGVDSQGCNATQRADDDSDGVLNRVDLCPNTSFDRTAAANGCAPGQIP